MVTIPIGVTESGEGYVKFPDGTLIQYGSYYTQDASQDLIITFPTHFIDYNYSISSCVYWYATGYYLLFFSESLKSIKAVARRMLDDSNLGNTETIGGRWIAVGRWK